jgi:hypothetical protein
MYKGFAINLEDDPVLSSKQWLEIAESNKLARQGAFAPLGFNLGIGRTDADKVRVSLEKRFGKMVDAFLRGRGIITDDESRQRLIDRYSLDLSEALKKLARNADGDYSEDEYAKRFPKFEDNSVCGPSHTLTGWTATQVARVMSRLAL